MTFTTVSITFVGMQRRGRREDGRAERQANLSAPGLSNASMSITTLVLSIMLPFGGARSLTSGITGDSSFYSSNSLRGSGEVLGEVGGGCAAGYFGSNCTQCVSLPGHLPSSVEGLSCKCGDGTFGYDCSQSFAGNENYANSVAPTYVNAGVAALIKSESGVGVSLPAGALTGDEMLEVRMYDARVKISDEQPGDPIVPCGSLGVFLPHGLTFSESVTLTLPFDPRNVTEGHQVAIFYYDEVYNPFMWVEMPSQRWSDAMGIVECQTTHFSIFAPMMKRLPKHAHESGNGAENDPEHQFVWYPWMFIPCVVGVGVLCQCVIVCKIWPLSYRVSPAESVHDRAGTGNSNHPLQMARSPQATEPAIIIPDIIIPVEPAGAVARGVVGNVNDPSADLGIDEGSQGRANLVVGNVYNPSFADLGIDEGCGEDGGMGGIGSGERDGCYVSGHRTSGGEAAFSPQVDAQGAAQTEQDRVLRCFCL